MDFKNVLRNWKTVFGNFKYLILGVIIAGLFYALNVLITDFRNLVEFYGTLGFWGTGKFFFLMMLGFYKVIELHSFVSLIIISILFGMFFSLLAYKVRVIKTGENKKVGFFASIGLFLGVLIPGCAACGVGLLSVLGLGAAFVAFLPFDGLELSVLAIVILSVVILKVSDELLVCKVRK